MCESRRSVDLEKLNMTDRHHPHDRRPVWDDDGWLEDPGPGSGWPAEIDIRSLSKPAVYQLDRACVGNLGVEGDLLLGWRGGDAIAAELN